MISKILLTLGVIILVLYGSRLLGEFKKGMSNARQQPTSDEPAGRLAAEDLVKCDVCGDFIPKTGAEPCGRDACPNAG